MFDKNFISDIKTIKLSIGKISQELSKIQRFNKNNCTEFITQKELFYAKLDFEVKNIKEKYKDRNDQMNKFFINIDKMVSNLKSTFNDNKIQGKICNK